MNIIAEPFQTKLHSSKLKNINVHRMLIFWKLNNSPVFPSDAPQIDNEESMLFGTDGFVFMIEEKEITTIFLAKAVLGFLPSHQTFQMFWSVF